MKPRFSKLALVLLAFFCLQVAKAQPPKCRQFTATRTTSSIRIDGEFNEAVWKAAPAISDFILLRPNPGKPEDKDSRTEMYVLYDNDAIYVAGFCHEKTKDSVAKELVGRDQIGSNDFAAIFIDTYHDRINAVGFFVTPLNEQYDARYAPNPNGNNEDASWNSVYQTAAKIVGGGWTFEMKIPYSCLRFNKKDIQFWGVNFMRKRSKVQAQYVWNEVKPTVDGFVNQYGDMTIPDKILPPMRLSFTPYFSTYYNNAYDKSNSSRIPTGSVNGGMDIKYGINESFTLDATLIPDFGQVQSDNKILNTSPFEVKYDEKRPFFIEGTELFNKGGLFYSRRIGGQPLHYYDAYGQIGNKETISNPSEAKLLNAIKLSGRTKKNLGIGIFNAIVNDSYATITDSIGRTRDVLTNPLTNYNIFVLDQSLKHNSSITFVNTNVLRSGQDYDANVSAMLFNLNNKKNTWNVSGQYSKSLLTGNHRSVDGNAANFSFGKTGGRLNFNLYNDMQDEKYNQNDMGYATNNNYYDKNLWIGYKFVKPSTWFNNMYINFNSYYSHRFKPFMYQSFSISPNINGQLKNLWYASINFNYNAEQNDFYESRNNLVFKRPSLRGGGFSISSNSAKKYYFDFELYGRQRSVYNGTGTDLFISQTYRLNDHVSFTLWNSLGSSKNMPGFAGLTGGNSIFGLRKQGSVENVFSTKYNFNNKMGINARLRHYWSKVEYPDAQFYTLKSDGYLQSGANFTGNANQNYDAFTLDLVYSWEFAPGSFVNIVWKNSAYDNLNNNTRLDYFKNLDATVKDINHDNNLSLKVLYYLDYNKLRKRHKV